MLAQPLRAERADIDIVGGVSFGECGFAIFDTDIQTTPYATIPAGGFDPVIWLFGSGEFAKDWVVYHLVLFEFHIKSQKIFDLFYHCRSLWSLGAGEEVARHPRLDSGGVKEQPPDKLTGKGQGHRQESE